MRPSTAAFLAFAIGVLLACGAAATRGSGATKHDGCAGFGANPSVFNFLLGSHRAKVISDGKLLFDLNEVYADDRYILRRALRLNYQSADPIVFENNMMYLERGDDRILFDVGSNHLVPETSGWLFTNLEAEGIDRDAITHIFINHGHFDHIGGLITGPGGDAAFPNAKVYIAQEEYDFWYDEGRDWGNNDLDDASQEFLVTTFQEIFDKVKPQVEFFKLGAEVVPGITSVSCAWHTPGCASYLIEAQDDSGEKLLYTGDAIGIESTSINNPWFRLRFDIAPFEGPLGRVEYLERMVQDNVRAVIYHATFPGLGYVVESASAWELKPANWEVSEGVVTRCPIPYSPIKPE